MKHTLILFSAILLLNCTVKKEAGKEESKVIKFMPAEKELTTAQKTWPEVTLDELKEGHSIYTNQCKKCHKNFEITKFSENKWKKEIDHMAPKAKITAEQKDKLTKFLLSYREANAVVKNN